MQWGYKGPEPEPVEDGLMEMAIAYLTEKGWYFDHERYQEVWEEPAGSRGIREASCWTVPQWGEYWVKPYHDKPGHENYGASPERRYVSLKEAIWDQILREQEPEAFGGFFRDHTRERV